MPSSRIITKLSVLLLLTLAFWHAQNLTHAVHGARFDNKHIDQYREQKTTAFAARSFAAGSSRHKETSQKRHKRLLISKVFRPASTVTFLKKFRLVEPVTDYSSPHVLKRTVAVSSLRGPPLS